MLRLLLISLAIGSLGIAQAHAFGGVFRTILGRGGDDTERSRTDFGALTAFEANAGLKEALVVGTNLVADQLHTRDGYFGDPVIQIPLPGRFDDIQKRLKPLGLSQPLDDLQLRMNRAAEASIPIAKTLVVDAITTMTVDDAIGILNGGSQAGTAFLRSKTESELQRLLRPEIETALSDVGALQVLDSVASRYGGKEMSEEARTSLVSHSVNYTLNGLFYYLGEEEEAIRQNPKKRTTEILRRVFGSSN